MRRAPPRIRSLRDVNRLDVRFLLRASRAPSTPPKIIRRLFYAPIVARFVEHARKKKMTQKSSSRVVRVESRRSQRTIARDAEVVGFGLWTGRDVRYRFHPAADDAGIAFYRADLPNAPRIPARVENRVAKPRQTSLAVGSAQVDMVEHVLAALRAARVDNCEIEVDAPEAPGMRVSTRCSTREPSNKRKSARF